LGYCTSASRQLCQTFKCAGFGGANNQAFDLAQSQLVLLLNPDTEVENRRLRAKDT